MLHAIKTFFAAGLCVVAMSVLPSVMTTAEPVRACGECDCNVGQSEDINCASSTIEFSNGPNFNGTPGECSAAQKAGCTGDGDCEYVVTASFSASNLDCGESRCANFASEIQFNLGQGSANPCQNPGGESTSDPENPIRPLCGGFREVRFEVLKYCDPDGDGQYTWYSVAWCKYKAICGPCPNQPL